MWINLLLSAHIPVVEMWDLTPSPLDIVVGLNQVRSGQKVAEFILENGDGKIGFDTAEDARAATRQQGAQETLIKYGVTDITVAKVPVPSSMELGRLGTTQLLKKRFFKVAPSSAVLTRLHKVFLQSFSQEVSTQRKMWLVSDLVIRSLMPLPIPH